MWYLLNVSFILLIFLNKCYLVIFFPKWYEHIQMQPPDVLKLAKFTGKYLCQSLFFNKVAGLRPSTLLKKRFWHGCFSVIFAKFLRTPFLQNSSGRLLLYLAIFFRKWYEYFIKSSLTNISSFLYSHNFLYK